MRITRRKSFVGGHPKPSLSPSRGTALDAAGGVRWARTDQSRPNEKNVSGEPHEDPVQEEAAAAEFLRLIAGQWHLRFTIAGKPPGEERCRIDAVGGYYLLDRRPGQLWCKIEAVRYDPLTRRATFEKVKKRGRSWRKSEIVVLSENANRMEGHTTRGESVVYTRILHDAACGEADDAVAYVDQEPRHAEQRRMDKIKILFLAANPSDTAHLALDEEAREIETKIRASEYRESLEFITKWAVRPDDLLQYLNEHRPHVVHFSGHGSEAQEIILKDSEGRAKRVSKQALRALFSTLKDNIRLVVLSACFSRAQAQAIVEQIDCAVGMNRAVCDNAAIAFAAAFYRAIGFGRSVQEAFDQGTTALLLVGIAKGQSPQLLCRVGVDPARVVLVERGRDFLVGRWVVGHEKKKGERFVITLYADGTARKDNPPRTDGTWEYCDGHARVTWKDGWRDIIRPDRRGATKLAFRPGTGFDSEPTNTSEAQKAENAR